jgi:hypothetical protein
MELLETQDPEKRRLIETSDRHKRELQKEVKSVSDRTERILTNALIIGGSLALTYFIVSQLGGWKTKKKKAKGKKEETVEGEAEEESALVAPSFISQIGSKVINQATLILLDIAREKLSEYLESRKNRDENS